MTGSPAGPAGDTAKRGRRATGDRTANERRNDNKKEAQP